MPNITFINAQGEAQTLVASDGKSLMQVAMASSLQGIVAECGGSAMCATCHVYVAPAWMEKIPPPNSNELELLECTASERNTQSRLSCQIRVTAELDGLVVTLPPSQ
jgi:2Fe-2S ferredoxin